MTQVPNAEPPRDTRPPSRRPRTALLLAIGLDLLQIVAMPVFAGGALSVAQNVVDVVAAIAMTVLLGWHWAFLPAFVAELVPIVSLIPTWTAAVLLVTRLRAHRR